MSGGELSGKLALVTGGSRGIGAAICEVLARKGAHLIINYTSAGSTDKTKELSNKLSEKYGTKSIIVQADLGLVDGPAKLIEEAEAGFKSTFSDDKPFQIDILVNNAGVSVNKIIEDCNAEDFNWQYNINVRGPLLLMQAALPYLPTDRSGRIVNLSSVSASLGFVGQSVYGGTKAALEAMTRTWARELAERATVNAVNPGPVATDMYGGVSEAFVERMNPFLRNTPLAKPRSGIDKEEFVGDVQRTGGRPASEEEIARLVGLLCSPEASFSTGSVLNANGGMYMSF